SNHLFLSSLFLLQILDLYIFFFSSRRRHTRSKRDWSSDVCSSDLASVFSFAAVIAFSSKSVPTAFSAPSNKAAIAKIPLPVPTSKITSFGFKYLRIARIHNWVVSCCPVPNAVPGSIWINNLSLCSWGISSQVGLIKISSTVNGLKYCFQLLIQSLSSVSEAIILQDPTCTNCPISFNPSSTAFNVDGISYVSSK